MKIIIGLSDHVEHHDLEVSNFLQVLDFLEASLPTTYERLLDIKCVWALATQDNSLTPVIICPELIETSIEGFDLIIIGESIEGEAFFTTLIASLTAAIVSAGVAAGTAGILATGIVTVAVAVGSAVLSYGLRQLIQAISPTNTFSGDGATGRQNLLLNGISNVTEQGGCVPIVLGECFFGAVKVGQNVYTKDISVTGNDDDLDKTIPVISPSQIKNAGNSKWYRVE